MEKNPSEASAVVDVDALMSRIREIAKQRVTPSVNAIALQEPEPLTLKPVQTEVLTQEIQTSTLSYDAINLIPLKSLGFKGGVEFRIKRFLKWLVHWNSKGQVEFNQSVLRSLGLIAQELHTRQDNFSVLADRLRDIEAHSSALERDLRGLEDLPHMLEEVSEKFEGAAAHVTTLEPKMGRMIEASTKRVKQNLHNEVRTAMAELRADSRRNVFQLKDHVNHFSALLEEVSGRWDAAAANLATLEPKIGKMIKASTDHVHIALGASEATLQEEMNRNLQQLMEETRSKTDTLATQSSELKKSRDRKLDERRMRTLRVERIAKNGSGAVDASAHHENLPDTQPDSQSQRVNKNEVALSATPVSSGKSFGRAFDYFLFEQIHRGPVSDIKQRQTAYLDLFREKANVVDLGCGRGEFLELLSENGINATGVDNNEDMVDFCRDRGLPVVHADIFQYLTSLPNGKLDGIFLAQVVEHLPPDQILELVVLCAEKLSPGGVVVIETPNPSCPEALGNFYLDPTHVRPVPAEMLRFILEQAHFQMEYLRFCSPIPGNEASEVLNPAAGLSDVYRDYAAVASRL